MSKTLTIRRAPACSADQLLRLISDREFLIARHRAQGAVEATVQELSRDDATLVQEVAVREPAHTMRGVDPRKLESATTTYRWDLPRRRGTWSYSGPHGGLVTISGGFRIEPQGDGCVFFADFEVSARVPLIGGMIEKRIIGEIEAGQPKVDALVDELLKRRSQEA